MVTLSLRQKFKTEHEIVVVLSFLLGVKNSILPLNLTVIIEDQNRANQGTI